MSSLVFHLPVCYSFLRILFKGVFKVIKRAYYFYYQCIMYENGSDRLVMRPRPQVLYGSGQIEYLEMASKSVVLSIIAIAAVLLLITAPILANHQTFAYKAGKYHYHGKYYNHHPVATKYN